MTARTTRDSAELAIFATRRDGPQIDAIVTLAVREWPSHEPGAAIPGLWRRHDGRGGCAWYTPLSVAGAQALVDDERTELPRVPVYPPGQPLPSRWTVYPLERIWQIRPPFGCVAAAWEAAS